jgi:hypothetical protein
MENVVIKIVTEANTKEAVNSLDKLSDKEKEVKKNFDEIGKSAKKAGNDTKKAAKETENSFDKLNGSLMDLGKTIAGAFAVEAIISFGKESVTAFAEAEEMGRKLEFAVKNIANGSNGALDLLLQQAEDLKNISIFDDDDIINAQQALLTYGLTTDEVSKLIPKVVDLASATGQDLASATDKIISGINGQTKGLKDVGLQFKDTGSKVENYNTILEKLNKFQGATVDATESTMGAMKRFDIFIGDLKESTGEFLKGIADGFMFMWDAAINGGEETVKQLQLTEKELKNIQDTFINMGVITDLQQASEEQLLKARLANEKQLEDIRNKNAKNDINIEATIGKFQADRISAINAEIQRRKELSNEVKEDADQYERLTNSISVLVSQFQNELAAKKQLNPEDVKRYKQLVKEKEAIDELIKKLTEKQKLEAGRGVRPTQGIESKTLTINKDITDEKEKQAEYDKQIQETQRINNNILETNKRELENYYKRLEELQQKRDAIILESINLASNLSNIYFENQLNQVRTEREERLKTIEDEKNARINQAGITAQKRAEYERSFEAERQRVLQETFEKEKKWKKQQAVINGALAITNILATTPDPTGTLTALRIASAVATTAAQVALIDAQKFEKGGWIGGKRHRDGGTLIEAEADEFVVNRKDAQANKGLLESLNKGMTEKYIYDKYVLPAILNKSLGQVNQQGLAENIANSLKYQMYDDHYLRKTFKQASMQSAQYIVSGLKSNQKPSRYV